MFTSHSQNHPKSIRNIALTIRHRVLAIVGTVVLLHARPSRKQDRAALSESLFVPSGLYQRLIPHQDVVKILEVLADTTAKSGDVMLKSADHRLRYGMSMEPLE
jgi:hypothetical protein